MQKGVKNMDSRILELLNRLGFDEHPGKPMLYQKQVDENTIAYIDFRKEHSGNAKGRRFAKHGEDFIDDPDEIEVLKQFKIERDKISGLKEEADQRNANPEIAEK